MKTVGIRELKNRLGEYLRLVRRGERILMTDRGEVYPAFEPLARDGTARELLDQERGER